jgi:hypothetical protein
MVAELREIRHEFRQSGRVHAMHARHETGVLGAAQLGVERAAEPHRPGHAAVQEDAPAWGFWLPAIICSSVDFPAPFRPRSATERFGREA